MFLIFIFDVCFLFCIFESLIFSINFHSEVWLLDWLHPPILTLVFTPFFLYFSPFFSICKCMSLFGYTWLLSAVSFVLGFFPLYCVAYDVLGLK